MLEYERILRLNAYDALAHYRLARLLDRQGFQRRAMETYSRFLTLWKDADPDIAEVRDARERVREAAVAMRGSRDSRAGIVR